ncbi:MAG TPA: APC family permease [Casimicrobiaceae bacterium]
MTGRQEEVSGLPRVLGLRDVVLLYAVAIIGPQWLSTAAQAGAPSLALWLLALIAFFVPCGFAVMEMNSRYAGEGGLYVWVKQAFGDLHGFVCGWSYVVSNIVFFPTLLLFMTAAAAYGLGVPGLKDDFAFNAVLSLLAVWFVVVANIFGLARAKWIPNAGSVVMSLVLVLLIAAAFVLERRFGSATTFAGALLPDLSDGSLVKAFATMMFGLVGYELAPLMGAEIREPRRVIPRAIVLSGLIIVAFYVGGTWALLAALPRAQIDALSGVPEAMATIASRLGAPALGPVASALIAIASIGGLAAWVTGGVRMPYVVGVDRYLPAALGRLHPRWHTPVVALVVVGVLTTALVLVALAGATVGEAYQVLVDMTIILTFVPLVYLFAALPVLRAKRAGEREAVLRIPGGTVGIAFVTVLGVGSTLLSIVFALAPPDHGSVPMFYAKVISGCVLFLGLGLVFYRSRSSGGDAALRNGDEQ